MTPFMFCPEGRERCAANTECECERVIYEQREQEIGAVREELRGRFPYASCDYIQRAAAWQMETERQLAVLATKWKREANA